MRLTNPLRNAFVHSVMNDVPQIDYDEEVTKILTEWAVSIMPPKVKAVWQDKELRDCIETFNFTQTLMDDEGGDVHVYGHYIPALTDQHNGVPREIQLKIIELYKLDLEQRVVIRDLRKRVEAVAYSCTTTKGLLKAMPEFEKYIPKDPEGPTKGVPAVANLVTDLIKAGWPKGGKPT